MPAPRKDITFEKFIQCLVESNGNYAETANRLNISRQHIFTLKKKYENEGKDISLHLMDIFKPKDLYTPVFIEIPKETLRIIAIGDHHDSPLVVDKSRITWIARHIALKKPDLVVQIGDIADFDSVSTHAAPGTVEYANRPSISADMESLEESFYLYDKVLPEGPPKRITAGNHEDRLRRYENQNPEVNGGVYTQFSGLCARYRWDTTYHGQWVFINKVGFIHTPFNQMGKEYGGRNPENQISNDALFSIVYGHTHKGLSKSVPKIGPAQSVEIINLGSSMPYGLVKKYAGRSTTGWTYGIWELAIRNGHIVGYNFIDMEHLKETYSD